MLMTSPVSDAQVIVGKWLGGLGFFAVLLVPTLAFVVLMAIWSEPDYGPIFTGYLGLLLVGGLYTAIGTFGTGAGTVAGGGRSAGCRKPPPRPSAGLRIGLPTWPPGCADRRRTPG